MYTYMQGALAAAVGSLKGAGSATAVLCAAPRSLAKHDAM